MPLVLASVALVLALVALVAAGTALRRTGGWHRGRTDEIPGDLAGLRREVGALRDQARGVLRHLAVVRYDAFGDMGGRLSWSVALLDEAGDGVVLTAIHGRSEARSYAKNVAGWASEQPLSPEEQEAVAQARRGP